MSTTRKEIDREEDIVILPEIIKIEFELSVEDALSSISVISDLLERFALMGTSDLNDNQRLGYIAALARIANFITVGVHNNIRIK